jgi:hypothetical protein
MIGFSQSPYGEGKIESSLINQKIENWQIEISNKETKSILDYYLLLPKKLLESENGIQNDSKDFRINSAENVDHPNQGKINLKDGYLIASPDAYLKMALFRNRVTKSDIIGIVLGCGMPPVQYCDYGFLEFDNDEKKWRISRDVFPWDEFNLRCKELTIKKPTAEEIFIPELILPEIGTTLLIIDSWDPKKTPVIKIIWNGEKFIIE